MERPRRHADPAGVCTDTVAWWQTWARGCTYSGGHWDAVVRSLITLKALTHRPTGGIVAAATTSLPEVIGGERNWDYRFCWLRDATFTLYALLTSGLTDEALAWREWLLRVAAGKPCQAQTIYGPTGERLLAEIEIDWLEGFEASRPVRVGNQAHRQLQLDIFGEVMDVVHVSGLKDDNDSWALQQALIDFIETGWRQPDNGIWEVRGPRQHFTHSKVMAWVALDRAIKAVELFGQDGPAEHWRKLRQTIHDEVCRRAFNPNLNSFTQYYGSDRLDASLLMLPLVGFLPPNDPRCLGTVAAVERELLQLGFVNRYKVSADVEGVHGEAGSFLACTFWLADNYALMGRTAEARDLFAKLLSIRNDVGLLAEEYDPVARRQLGNSPQALSHVALVNSAHNLTATSPAVYRASP